MSIQAFTVSEVARDVDSVLWDSAMGRVRTSPSAARPCLLLTEKATVPPVTETVEEVTIPEKKFLATSYFYPCCHHPDDFKERVRRAAKGIRQFSLGKKFSHDSYAFVVRGVSGAVFGSALAYEMDIPLVIVRKPRSIEKSHSCHYYEGLVGFKSYFIVDDTIDSGATVRAIRAAVVHRHNDFNYPQPVLEAALLYGGGGYIMTPHQCWELRCPLCPEDFERAGCIQ